MRWEKIGVDYPYYLLLDEKGMNIAEIDQIGKRSWRTWIWVDKLSIQFRNYKSIKKAQEELWGALT